MSKSLLRGARVAVSVVMVTLMVATFCFLPVSAAKTTESSLVSTYTCDFENNYLSSAPGTIAPANGSNALKFDVKTSAQNHYFEIYNSAAGGFTLTNGNVYAVQISYKVDNIASVTKSDVKTTINLVRFGGAAGTLVKVRSFADATFVPGDTTGWVTACIIFKASIAESAAYNKLAINVVSPTCASSVAAASNFTTIWFDNITITECKGSTNAIEFQSNGGDFCEPVMAQAGEAITLPTPTRDLYNFVGWYSNSALSKSYNSSKMPSAFNTKLYAKWTPSADAIKIKFAYTYGDELETLVGRPGDKAVLPTPTRENFHFAGWYSDSGLKNEVSNFFIFPDKNTTLYAKWEVVPFFCGFENKGDFSEPNNGPFTLRCIIDTNKEHAYNGNNCVYYNMEKSTTVGEKNQGTIILINEYGKMLSCVPGELYTITFKYKVEEVTLPGGFGITFTGSNEAWSQRVEMHTFYDDDPNRINITAEDVGKGWQTGTFTVTCQSIGNSRDYSYIGIGMAGNAKYYVDDIVVYKVDGKAKYNGKCMLTFDSQGGTYCDTAYGNFGDKVTMPSNPVRPGYNFMGWYKDADCTNHFGNETFTYGYQTVYASWEPIPNYVPSEDDPVYSPVTGDDTVVDAQQGGEVADDDEEKNNMILYIIIAAAAVVVIVVVVIVLVLVGKKKKAGKAEETEKADDSDKAE